MLINSLTAESRKVLSIRVHYIALIVAALIAIVPSWFIASLGIYQLQPAAAYSYVFALYAVIGVIATVVTSSLIVTGEY